MTKEQKFTSISTGGGGNSPSSGFSSEIAKPILTKFCDSKYNYIGYLSKLKIQV